jgi:uncharacterized membrane protein HdeD (DUF308 family)
MPQASTAPDAETPWAKAVVDDEAQPFPWYAVLITGALGVAFGLAVLIWPEASLRIMAALAGVWLLVSGLARIIGALVPSGGSVVWRVLSGVVGIVVLVAGLICLRDVVTRLAVLSLLFAITWILGGVITVAYGLRRVGSARLGLIVVGALSLLAGLVFAVMPKLSLGSLVVLTGVSSLAVGIGEVILALGLRKYGRE